jgi:hypothetical protein
MDDDEMPKVDPRLWNLSDDARAAQYGRLQLDDATVELGADDLEDDVTSSGLPSFVTPAMFTPGLASPSAPRASAAPAGSTPARASTPPRTVPPRISTLPRVPPPPRSRSLAPAPPSFELLPPIANITAFESTAPMVRTLSEPVIPIQPPPPGWNWRPWVAGAGALFGLTLYGLSVLDLAASSPRASNGDELETVAAASPEAALAPLQQVPVLADVEAPSAANMPPVTAAVIPLAAQAAADDAASLAPAEPEERPKASASRKWKKKKKAGARSWKKKKLAKAKASSSSLAKSFAAFKFSGGK